MLERSDMITRYTVTGMSCDHCVTRITGELVRIPGVTAVAIDLPTGVVSVSSSVPLDRSDIDAAIDEAGYELAEA